VQIFISIPADDQLQIGARALAGPVIAPSHIRASGIRASLRHSSARTECARW